LAPLRLSPLSKDADGAVKIANGSPYGLQSSVFSENIHNALKVAHRLEVGGVVINVSGAFRPGNVPFGGFEQERHWAREPRASSTQSWT